MTNPEAAEKEEDATAGVMQVEAETDQKQEDAEADVMQVGTETDQKQVEATDEDAKEEDDEEEGSSYSSYSSSSSQEKEVDAEKAEEEKGVKKELAKLKKKKEQKEEEEQYDQNKRLKKTLDDQKLFCWQSQQDLYRDNFTLHQHMTTMEVMVEDVKAYRNQLRHLYDLKEKGKIEAARKFEERMQKCMRGKEKIMKALAAIDTAEDDDS